MSLYAGDKRAAFVGMIVTTALLFIMVFTIVKLTNAKFDKAHPPAAGATH